MEKSIVSRLVAFSIKHSGLVRMATLAMCILGIVGLFYINKDEFPTFQINQGLVVGVYPGATAAEVEQNLVKPLEDMLLGIPEVRRENLECVSKDGLAYIYVDLNCSQTRKKELWGVIKHKLIQQKLLLPPGVLAVQVLDDFSDVSSILLSLESDDKGWEELEECAQELKSRLLQLKQVASVNIIGTQKEEIAVTVDMERLSRYGISPSTLMLSYTASSLNLPAGQFDPSYTSAPIFFDSGISSEEELAQKTIYSDPLGNIVRLKDIATIERRVRKPSSFVKHNGCNALVMNLVMRPDNNIVAFGHKVDKIVDEFCTSLPPSIKVTRVSDQPKVVDKSVMGFLRDLLISMLVVIFVMIMMFPMRSALIASSGVPVCTLVTIAVMYMTGMALNTVTLAALIVVLGMIVDDSIITMDGYMDNLAKGMGRKEAAVAAANELFLPMFMATLSICAMFFPMLGIITGYLGDFIRSFPWIILIALMTSLVYAVTVVPSLEVRFIGSHMTESKGFIAKMQDKLFALLQKGYEKVQVKAFKHPYLTLSVGVAALVLGVVMFSQINVQMMPFAPRSSFAVEINMQSGCNIDDTEAVADSLGKLLLEESRIIDVTAFVGSGAPRYHATYTPKTPSPLFAQLIVNTRSDMATEELLPYLEARYEHYFPNALIRIKQMDYQGTNAPVCVRVKSSHREDCFAVADSIKNFMYGLNRELKWVHCDGADYVSDVHVQMDPVSAGRLGVDKAGASMALNLAFGHSTLMTLDENGKSVQVNLYDSGVGDDMEYAEIGSRLVPSMIPGVSVPLRQVAEIQPEWHMNTLCRYSSMDCISINADLKYGISHPSVMKKIDAYVQGLELPEGVEVKYGGLSSSNETVGVEIVWAFIAAVAVMFLFLLMHFRKVSLTVLSLVLCLLCLFGASFGLWAFNQDFGMTSVLGIVSLIGIIVRNGIIMFEYAEELHFKEGYTVRESAMLAGQRRMRPIFLTSCTTALGVLPMILAGDALWQPVGLTICFGIVFSILLIVFIMPVSYWLVFDRKSR